ncbi:carboxylesterase [Lentzea guizhouensis]|uniref:Carboxylic ester hydrolase n=1 Tax=Lentzea guizhouensis TaxID=1586287 RepID=A0A1B2I0P5_9PSEU|nr:carboxylesterase family protein [Lentzea guizhouensis]ANZ43525.1 carboxylesterase [Lentzea guizhouensis]
MVEVRVAAGAVRGAFEGEVAVFRGIPFAAPPVGPHRFAAPHPVEPWDGVRDALEFGPPPPQGGAFGMDRAVGGDDWLTANVWSPDLGSGLPVLVWIHGGAYTIGMSSLPEYDGTRLARGGVVVVTFNYRVGLEGFGAFTGSPANRGLLDQVAALEWVRDNIHAFGGDPARVTVFGESAGGGSVAALLAMPRARGLFQRAVASSAQGTFFSPELAADIAAACVAELGEDVSTVDPAVLPLAGDEVTAKMSQFARWGKAAHRGLLFAPVVDGEVLPVDPWQALADGAAAGVDLLVGHTRDEQRLFTVLDGQAGAVTDELASATLALYAPGDYRAAFPSASPEELHDLVQSDWIFRMPTLRLAEEQLSAGGRAWVYELTWEGPLGACHGLDVPLLFGNLDRGQPAALIGEVTEEVAELSARMRAAWTSFATSGDPGWPQFSSGLVQIFSAEPAVAPYPEETSRRLWAGHRFGALPLLDRE